MEIIELLTIILASYRISRLLPKDDGPFFIFKRIRSFFMTKAVAENDEWGKWNILNEGITCAHCMGLYAALFCGLLMIWHNFYGNLFLLIMAIAGGQSLLERLGEKE